MLMPQREIGRSSFVSLKWGGLFLGSFPVKCPGARDTENISLYPCFVLHKSQRERKRWKTGDGEQEEAQIADDSRSDMAH